MLCEHYKEALIEAAASGLEPRGELRAHLDACVSCRAGFEQEQTLFASIDAGLCVTANAEMPASLLPRTLARLDEAVAPHRRWSHPWIIAAASVAVALAIFQFGRPHHSSPDNQAEQIPQIPVSDRPATNPQQQNSDLAWQIVSSDVKNSRTRDRSTFSRPVASSQPEVLVPADERDAFACFVATLQEHREMALALVTPAADEQGQPASLKPLQIDRIEVKPLERTESAESDGAENIR